MTLALRDRLPRTRGESLELYAQLLTQAAERDEATMRANDRKNDPDSILPVTALREAKRWLSRNDLFYLMSVTLHRPDLNHDWLFDRCREIEREPNGYLDLWAREHYKSTIITYGLAIQDILASHGDSPEPRYQGREVTIGIFSFNRPIAKQFLRQIKVELETNKELQDLFPDVLWSGSAGEIQRQAPKWSEDDGIIVRRKTNPKESTVEAWGLVDGQPTSKHFWILNYDDVVTRESVTTAEMIKKVTEAWELSTNLGTEGGWERYAGTRYHLFDTYATMMERGIPTRIYPCTSDGSEDFENKSVLRSPEFLRGRRTKQGPYTFGAQMLLNPTADRAQGFNDEWLEYWAATTSANLNVYMVVDPASKKKKSNDYTTIWVVGVDGAGNYMVLDVIRDRLNLTERQKAVFMLHRKWQPIHVGYEEYGLQADIEHIRYVQELENYRFHIIALGGQMAKEDRIKRLVPVFEQRRMFMPQNGIVRQNHEGVMVDMIRAFVEEEYKAFPVVSHDDMLDSLSRMLDKEMLVTRPMPPPPKAPKWLQDEINASQSHNWQTR